MFLVTINRNQQLLYLCLIGQVEVGELVRGREQVAVLLTELQNGFRCLTDLCRLDSLSADCAPEIGKIMELCDQKGVGLVVRVIPDPAKDIGLNILVLFHYRKAPRTITCQSMIEAAQALSL